MRYIVLMLAVLSLVSCSVLTPPVPPRVFSLESALKIPFDEEVSPREIDSFMDVDVEGMAVTHDGVVFYGFKFDDPRDSKRIFKKIISKHILKLKLMDTPWFGRFELKRSNEKLVVWWKDVWLFAIEGRPEEVDSFLEKVEKVFSALD